MHKLKLDPRIDDRWKNLEKIRWKMIIMDNQIIMNFMANSPQSVWRITLNTLLEICSVKNVNQRKKPHPNRLTRTNAGASHLLKKLIWTKILHGGGFFWRRWIRIVTNAYQKKTFLLCNSKLEEMKRSMKCSISFESSFHEEYENDGSPLTTPLIGASNPSSTASSMTLATVCTITEEHLDLSSSILVETSN